VVEDSLRTSRPAWDAWMLEGSREDLAALAPAVDVPTLVVAGGADPVMDRAMLEREVRDRITGARMLAIGGVGHLVPYEAPDELAGHVRAFLGQLAPAGGA
jgi:pimeloyl-ACP methyl ester carboxylesterase